MTGVEDERGAACEFAVEDDLVGGLKASSVDGADGAPSAKASGKRKGKGKRPRVSGHVVPDSELRSRLPPPASGNLYLYRPIEKESLKVNIYNPDGSYNVEAIKAASHMLRCRRTNTEKDMEPRLLGILSHVFDHFGERRLEIVSGFRIHQGGAQAVFDLGHGRRSSALAFRRTGPKT